MSFLSPSEKTQLAGQLKLIQYSSSHVRILDSPVMASQLLPQSVLSAHIRYIHFCFRLSNWFPFASFGFCILSILIRHNPINEAANSFKYPSKVLFLQVGYGANDEQWAIQHQSFIKRGINTWMEDYASFCKNWFPGQLQISLLLEKNCFLAEGS